jgi:hypothetical protein
MMGRTGAGWRIRSPPNAIEIALFFLLFSPIYPEIYPWPPPRRSWCAKTCPTRRLFSLFIRLRRALAVPVDTVALRVWTPVRRFLTIAGSALAGLVLLPILLVVALIVSVKVSRLDGSGIDSWRLPNVNDNPRARLKPLSAGHSPRMDAKSRETICGAPVYLRVMGYPGSPHLWHPTANVCGYGGAQQEKCNDKSDEGWDLPHGYVSRLLGRAAATNVRGGYYRCHEKARDRSPAPCFLTDLVFWHAPHPAPQKGQAWDQSQALDRLLSIAMSRCITSRKRSCRAGDQCAPFTSAPSKSNLLGFYSRSA